MDKTSDNGFPMLGEGGRRDWIDARNYSAVQRFFIGRLERLVTMRRNTELHFEAWQTSLINRSIYSTYCDCVEQELADEARILVRREQETPPTPASA